jgi:hypothetical protein
MIIAALGFVVLFMFMVDYRLAKIQGELQKINLREESQMVKK